jgi:hypothetical protein
MMVLIAQKGLLLTSQYQEVITVTLKLNSKRHLVHLTLGAQEEQRSQSHALEEFFALLLVRLAFYAQLVAMFKIIQLFNWLTHALFVLSVSTLRSRMSNARYVKPVMFAWEELLDNSQQARNITMVLCVRRVTIVQQIPSIQLSAQLVNTMMHSEERQLLIANFAMPIVTMISQVRVDVSHVVVLLNLMRDQLLALVSEPSEYSQKLIPLVDVRADMTSLIHLAQVGVKTVGKMIALH